MTPRIRILAAADLAVITAASALVGAAPAPARAPAADRLVVLAGSPHAVVYADYPVGPGGRADYSQGRLHERSDTGRDRDLGVAGDTEPGSAARVTYSLVGSSLTSWSAADPGHVRWWDLAAHTSGTGTLPDGAHWQGSSPDGWLVVEADGSTVATESRAGQLTSYGVAATAPVTALGGPSGFIVLAASGADLTYQRWDSSTVTSLDLGSSRGSAGLSCGDVSGAIAACVDRGADGDGTSELAVPLDGSPARTATGCGAPPVAVMDRLVWVCGHAHPHPWFAGSAHAKRSAARVAPVPGVSAFGDFVSVGHNRHAVIAVASARASVHPVVRVASALARADQSALRAAAAAVHAEAVAGGALSQSPTDAPPAQVLQEAVDALLQAAATSGSAVPADTRELMGPVPAALRHREPRHPHHRHVTATHTLLAFQHAVPDSGSPGLGMRTAHGGSMPAPFQPSDGVYVEPRMPALTSPTVGMVAVRAALHKLGLPYVWAGGGPRTFDCSGLVQWAYAHAGLRLTHYTGSQWNEGRLVKPKQVLPGDLVLFEHLVGGHEDVHHVGIYLGAGWMVNAPYTGRYVDVVQVPRGVAGIVRP